MLDVNVIVFIESPIVKTFLFESSKYWASEGFPVHYISSYMQENLPPLLQGTKSETQTYAQFMQITFLAVPQINDLIDYLISLQKSSNIPKVIVVEDITSYIDNSTETDYLLLCSLLKNTVHLCSQAHGSTSFLIISSKFKPEKLNIINLIFNPTKIWRSYEDTKNDKFKTYILREISLNPACNTTKELQFTLLENDDNSVLRLNCIKHLFEDSCNFNNAVL